MTDDEKAQFLLLRYLTTCDKDDDVGVIVCEIAENELTERDPNKAYLSEESTFGPYIMTALPYLWQYIKLEMYRKKRTLVLDEAERRVKMIAVLVEAGAEPEKAARLVDKTINAVAKRNDVDRGVVKLIDEATKIIKELYLDP